MIVVWLPKAITNRDAQISRIAKDSAKAAIEQGDRIEQQINQLIAHPEIGRAGRKQGTRELVPFIVIYRIRGDRIELIRLLHGAQQWP